MAGGGMATLSLLVEKGPKEGEIVECKRGRAVRIGRIVRGNTFAIKDPAISERHISIETLGDRDWSLTDLDTSNGTFINDRQIDPLVPTRLADGDIIKIGSATSIKVRISGVPDESESKPKQSAEEVVPPKRGRPRKKVEVAKDIKPIDRKTRGASRREAAVEPKVDAVEEEREASVDEEEKNQVARHGEKVAPVAKKGRGTSKRKVSNLEALDETLEVDQPEKKVGPLARKGRGAPRRASDLHAEQSISGRESGDRSVALVEQQDVAEDATGEVEISNREDVLEGEHDGAKVADGDEKIDMENMTLGQWFDRLEKVLPIMINDVAEEIIAEIREKADEYKSHIKRKCKGV